MKAKSDNVLSPLSPLAIAAMLAAVAQVPVGGIAVLRDTDGGAIADPAATDTAFPRRAGTQYAFNISGLLQIEWVIFVILRRFRYLMAMRSPIGDR